jgi:hypothetical protein
MACHYGERAKRVKNIVHRNDDMASERSHVRIRDHRVCVCAISLIARRCKHCSNKSTCCAQSSTEHNAMHRHAKYAHCACSQSITQRQKEALAASAAQRDTLEKQLAMVCMSVRMYARHSFMQASERVGIEQRALESKHGDLIALVRQRQARTLCAVRWCDMCRASRSTPMQQSSVRRRCRPSWLRCVAASLVALTTK